MLPSNCVTKASFFRLVAIALLLFTGAGLLACELLDPARCESFGCPPDGHCQEAGASCICCCAHIVVPRVAPLEPAAEVVSLVPPVAVPKAERAAASIYHPPKV